MSQLVLVRTRAAAGSSDSHSCKYTQKRSAQHLADAGPRARHPAALKQSKFSARIELYDYNLTFSCFFPKTCPVRRGHFGKTFRFMFFRITKHQKRRGCLLWIRAGFRCDVLLTCLRLFQLYKDRRWTVSPPPLSPAVVWPKSCLRINHFKARVTSLQCENRRRSRK